MKVSYILYFFLSMTSSRGDTNIIINKSIYASSNRDDVVSINDGDSWGCYYSSSVPFSWVVVDLQNVTKIAKLVLTNDPNTDPMSIYIGDDFSACSFHLQYKNYRLCKRNVVQTSKRMEIVCDTEGRTGQFLAFVRGDYLSQNNPGWLQLCELEAFGSGISVGKTMQRPIITSVPLDPIPSDYFSTAKAIRKDVSSFTVPWYSQSFSYVGNCQPIIWDSTTKSVFSLACQTADGKGRLTTFGKSSVFSGIVADPLANQLKLNLFKFLSPKTTAPSVIAKKTVKTMADLLKVKTGDILDFNVAVAYPEDVLAAMVLMVQNGTLGVNIDYTFYVGTTQAARNSYMRILNLFNVDFNAAWTTWSTATVFKFSDSDFSDSILSIDEQISRISKNHDYLLNYGRAIATTFAAIPASIFAKSSVKTSLLNLITKYHPLMTFICPCKGSPAVDPSDRRIIGVYGQLVQSQILVDSNYKLPCIDLFPGDFETSPTKKKVSMTVEGQIEFTDNPIGYYLEAGTTLSYVVTNSVGSWSMSVGCHTDRLGDERPAWTRYPYITVERVLLGAQGQVFSPFGGAIWLYNEAGNQTITITLSNVVASPFFNLRAANAASDWEAKKSNPGLWTQIAGDNMVFCEKSSNLRGLDGAYLVDLMKNNWDNLVKMDHGIKGMDWRLQRPQRTVLDIMTNMGYGHSGYPIVVWDDWFSNIFNKTVIFSEGSWGMCHEIGHNMQENVWTFSDVVEVTNNLMCLFNHDKLWKLPRFGRDETVLRDHGVEIKNHLNGAADFNGWKSTPWISLGIYAQMVKHFGWGFYKSVFEYYRVNVASQSGDANKMAMWINVTSRVTQQNLAPLFTFWGIPIKDEVKQEISKLPCFFPNDFWTQFSVTRTALVALQYPNCNAVSTYYVDYDPTKDIQGMRPNYITELSTALL